MSERQIQRRILLDLSDRGLFVWRNETGAARSMDGKRVIRFGLPGSPDILGLAPGGRALGVEVKTATGKQRPDQAAFQKAFEAAGGLYILARSPEEAIAAIFGSPASCSPSSLSAPSSP